MSARDVPSPVPSRPVPLVVEKMLARPGSYALVQAVDLTLRHLRGQGLAPGQAAAALRYKVNPELSFPPGDIASLTFTRADAPGSAPEAVMVLNFMGLHGAASPIPAYFTEHVAQHQDEPDALRDFFDIFHQRLAELLHDAWRKYRYHVWFETGAVDVLSYRFSGFMGVGHPDLREAKKLRWPRLMAYIGLIAFNAESAGSLESILRHYFSHASVYVVPCMRRWVSVPDDQRARLGISACRLGEEFILGEEVPDQTGKFRVRIEALTWERFNEFLPCGEKFGELRTLIKFALRSRLDFDVELRLLPKEIRPWRMEGNSECRLGWSAWAGDGGDGIVVLKTEHQES